MDTQTLKARPEVRFGYAYLAVDKGEKKAAWKVIKSLILREKEEQSPVLEWGESRGCPGAGHCEAHLPKRVRAGRSPEQSSFAGLTQARLSAIPVLPQGSTGALKN